MSFKYYETLMNPTNGKRHCICAAVCLKGKPKFCMYVLLMSSDLVREDLAGPITYQEAVYPVCLHISRDIDINFHSISL